MLSHTPVPDTPVPDLHVDVILEAVMKALVLNEEMNGSQKSFMNILQYGKELYYKNHSDDGPSSAKYWPNSWQSSMRLLREHGYKEPKQLYICLNTSHPHCYDILNSLQAICKYCGENGSTCIKYSYLTLGDKINRWCQNEIFCKKMTAHWTEREHWLQVQGGHTIKKELWDGSRFGELSWFWDPSSEWILPTWCPLCKEVISSKIITEALEITTCARIAVPVECPACFHMFSHCVKTANGDPRNIALIGHWDGWQPFSSSGKHSSGNITTDGLKIKIDWVLIL